MLKPERELYADQWCALSLARLHAEHARVAARPYADHLRKHPRFPDDEATFERDRRSTLASLSSRIRACEKDMRYYRRFNLIHCDGT